MRYSLWLNGTAQFIDHGDVLDAVMAGPARQVTYLVCHRPESTGKETVLLGKWDESTASRQFQVRLHGRDWGIFPTPDRVTFSRFRVYYENK